MDKDKCWKCGSKNLHTTIMRDKNDEFVGWTTTCNDCGALIDED